MQQYTAASAVQQEAETKLATNMRNTMGARDEDIQSIKDLCAAQQQLGVIGDEVQLAGAQELATYLEKKSSLEKLIPVMNDMVAQQYGLNATQESAANIATMLGKVMDGQVGALSRYGYKFDEAQAQILKFGTEEQRVAVLAEVVESAVGGMNEALAKTDAGRAKQAANDFTAAKDYLWGSVRGGDSYVYGYHADWIFPYNQVSEMRLTEGSGRGGTGWQLKIVVGQKEYFLHSEMLGKAKDSKFREQFKNEVYPLFLQQSVNLQLR